jgi:hypothetical protein
MRPLIYLRDSDEFTVPRGLKSMLDQFGFGGEWHWEYIVTASVITTVPMIIVFLVAQKQIIEGIATTGTKGWGTAGDALQAHRRGRAGRPGGGGRGAARGGSRGDMMHVNPTQLSCCG